MLDCQSQLTVELLDTFQQMGKLFLGLFSVLFQVYQTECLILIATLGQHIPRTVWNGGITKEQSNEIERFQKRALKIIYKEDDYNKALRIAKIERLEKRRDRMCIELIKEMSNPNHKLHSLLPKKICEVRKKATRLNNQMYYNFMGKTERFKGSPISYAISKYNETLSG